MISDLRRLNKENRDLRAQLAEREAEICQLKARIGRMIEKYKRLVNKPEGDLTEFLKTIMGMGGK